MAERCAPDSNEPSDQHSDYPELSWSLDPSAAVVARVRHQLQMAMAAWAMSEDDRDRTLLVVNELVSNVVDHARTPFRASVRLISRIVHVRVQDDSLDPPVVQPLDRTAARGRGLQLVGAIASRWGYATTAHGKTVWATVDLAEPALHH